MKMRMFITLLAVVVSAQASAWWGNNGYNNNDFGNGYGSGYGTGYGNYDQYGRGYGSGAGSGDMDGRFDFTISGRARGNSAIRGNVYSDYYGNGNFYGYGNGYNNYYNRPYYGYVPPYYAYPMVPPAAPKGPADDDKDGVANTSDLCPDTVAGSKVDMLGCSDTARIVLRGVNFKTDSDELTGESLAILDRVSKTLAANPQIQVVVAGHTDSDGDDAYNKDLSQRRAQTVVNYLVSQKVDPNNLIAKGYGEEQPVAGNDTAEGKAQNRRVELNRL
jgi:outer membrane protein OmpA-like peptidoglycan-associated protein